MKQFFFVGMLSVALLCTGCMSRDPGTQSLQLGMTPGDVVQAMGSRYVVRASKQLEGGDTTQVWEYYPKAFTLNPQTYWVVFENGKVVQWGQPGDYLGSAKNVKEYTAERGQ